MARENKYTVDDYFYLMLLLAARRVSKEDYDKYQKEFMDYIASNKTEEWIREISNYYMEGKKAESDLIETARKGKDEKEIKERLCEAYYYLGEHRLMQGDRKAAEEFFRKSIETDVHTFIEYRSSKAMLKLMEEGKL